MAGPVDPTSLLGASLRIVVVASVDLATATCRVRDGDIESADLPWLAPRAGDLRVWSPPSVGEQALLICPEGDPLAGVVLPGLFSNAKPAPSDKREWLGLFGDDARIGYDPTGHVLSAVLPAGSTARIVATDVVIEGKLRVTGDATFDAKVAATGEVTSAADVKAGNTSLKLHKHTAVATGSAISGPPQ